MKYVLYNPYSGNGDSKLRAESLIGGGASLVDMTDIGSYAEFFGSLGSSDCVVICGGDGTLNRFVNDTAGVHIECELLYMPTGTGNDFAADIEKGATTEPFALDEYVRKLPTVTVDGKDYRFINGVGYGIDGYCCEIGDKMKADGKQPNYTSIAISGLLFHYKPTDATVTVDGKEYRFKKVWIAPTMYGRHYGGGMIPTPEQKRGTDELSVMIFHGSGKLKTLMIFPSIFKGEHVKKEKNVTVLTGKEISVRFDEPRPLQIDGETHLGVREYTAKAPAYINV